MVEKEVIWTGEAKFDVQNILDYWIERNGSTTYSEKLLDEFDEMGKQIGKYPSIGKTTEIEDVRYAIVRTYAITYHISENIIHILSVWDERRDPETRPV
ncbi:MAG: type II toxin-antitoxin system RelE/ParE family toxin [Flavobacteriales bacterium]|nr:type II toxin-antitoxin system RelE/ParE family toxin [Flavobacteriales bacterium]